MIEESYDMLRNNIHALDKAGREAGLKINVGKTKTMVFGKEDPEGEIKIGNERIENVKEFVYLGSLSTWDNDCSKDIRARIAKGKGIMAGFNSVWKSKNITYETKLSILRTCVFSTALYGCEAWMFKKN